MFYYHVVEIMRWESVSLGVVISNACGALRIDWFKLLALYKMMLPYLPDARQEDTKGSKEKVKSAMKQELSEF